jgi:hypothetical protein
MLVTVRTVPPAIPPNEDRHLETPETELSHQRAILQIHTDSLPVRVSFRPQARL